MQVMKQRRIGRKATRVLDQLVSALGAVSADDQAAMQQFWTLHPDDAARALDDALWRLPEERRLLVGQFLCQLARATCFSAAVDE